MRRVLIFLSLFIVLSAVWIGVSLLETRQEESEDRLIGALKFIEDAVEASSEDIFDANVYHSPSIEPTATASFWVIRGIANMRTSVGKTKSERYIAVVENLCDSYSNRRCWRLESFTVRGQALALSQSVTRRPAEIVEPATASSADTTPPTVEEARTGASEAPEADRVGDTPPVAEAHSDGRSTNEDGQARDFGQQQVSLAPPADPARDTSPSSTGAAWTQLDRTRVVLMQSRLKMLGFRPGVLDGIIGPRTVAAIEDYQRAQGLAVDGKPTRELLAHLGQQSLVPGPRNEARSGTKVSQTSPVTAVHRTSSADTAAPHATPRIESLLFLIRSRLRQLGFDPGPLSGEFGPQARTAVKEYQRKNGLPVDGQPTWALLNHLEQVGLAQSRIGEGDTKIKGSGEPRARVDGYEHFKRAIAAAKDGAQDLAIEQYTRAIGAGNLSQEHLAYAFNNRGQGYFLKGLLDRATEDFDKAIQLSPNFSMAYHNRGLVYHKKGLYNRADDDYSKAIQLKPDLSYAYFNRGGMYEAKGEQQNALQDFQKAYSLDPSSSIYRTKMKELGLLN